MLRLNVNDRKPDLSAKELRSARTKRDKEDKQRQKEKSKREERCNVYCDVCWCRTSTARFYAPTDVIAEQSFWVAMLHAEMRDLHLADPSGETWLENRFLNVIEMRRDWVACPSCATSLACKGQLKENESAYKHMNGKYERASTDDLRSRYGLGRENLLAAWSRVHGGAPVGLSETYSAAVSILQRLRRTVRLMQSRKDRRNREISARLRCSRCRKKSNWRPWYYTSAERDKTSLFSRQICLKCGAAYCVACVLKFPTEQLADPYKVRGKFGEHDKVKTCPCGGLVLGEFENIV